MSETSNRINQAFESSFNYEILAFMQNISVLPLVLNLQTAYTFQRLLLEFFRVCTCFHVVQFSRFNCLLLRYANVTFPCLLSLVFGLAAPLFGFLSNRRP